MPKPSSIVRGHLQAWRDDGPWRTINHLPVSPACLGIVDAPGSSIFWQSREVRHGVDQRIDRCVRNDGQVAHRMDGVNLESTHGLHKISPGCKFCYAERMAKRLQAMGNPNYRHGFKLSLHEHVLNAPLAWKKPQIRVCELNERYVSRRCPVRVHRKDVYRDAPRVLASISDPHQAI